MEKCIHTPRPDAEGKRSSQEAGGRTENAQGSRRGEFDNNKWEDSGEKKFRILESNTSSVDSKVCAATRHGFKCVYFNAQSLRHKMPQLLALVEARNPDVIGITESWGDSEILDSEFTVPGFSLFRADRSNGHRGGGVLLFVNSDMNAVEVKMTSTFSEQVWCKVKIMNGDELYIGVCYRSPNTVLFGQENDRLLCDLIAEVSGRPLLLMGDFNYPDIDWCASHGQSVSSQNFVNCVEEGFLTQHVTEGTRKGSILDLVITSEPDMIDAVTVLDNFGNSDHNVLEWTVQHSTSKSVSRHPVRDYSRANFPAIRRELMTVDWCQVLQGDANEKWQAFCSVIKGLEDTYVPMKKHGKLHKKAPWLSHKAVKLELKKKKLYKKYKNVKHPAYMKAAREASLEIRRSKRNFERKLAKNIDTDKKSFYAYVRSRSRTRPAVNTLVNSQDVTTVQPNIIFIMKIVHEVQETKKVQKGAKC